MVIELKGYTYATRKGSGQRVAQASIVRTGQGLRVELIGHARYGPKVLAGEEYTQGLHAHPLCEGCWQGIADSQVLQAYVGGILQVARLALTVLVIEQRTGQISIGVSLTVTVLNGPAILVAEIIVHGLDTGRAPSE